AEAEAIDVGKGAFDSAAALECAVAARPVAVRDADVAGVAAADRIHYAIMIANNGDGAVYDLQVRDQLPPGIGLGAVSELRLLDGSGAEIDFSGGDVLRDIASGAAIRDAAGFADALFCGSGVEFVDPASGQGVLGGDCGGDRLTIAYAVTLPTSVVAGSTLVNEASVVGAAARECGPNLISDCDPPGDSARVTIAGAELATALIDTNQAHTRDSDAVIGEILTYRTVITLPEGTSPDAVLTQTLEPGLSLVAIDSVTVSDGVELGRWPDLAAIQPTDHDGGSANRFVIDFGTVRNSNTANCDADTVTVVYRAVTANVLENQQGATRITDAGYQSGAGPGGDCGPLVDLSAAAEPIRVVEPVLMVDVVPDGGSVTAGGVAEFTVTIRNDSEVDAFDVTIDPIELPGGLAGGRWQLVGPAASELAATAPTLAVLRAGEQATLRLVADVAADAAAGQALPIDVAVRYTSLPDSQSYADGYPPGTDNNDLSPHVTGSDRERTGASGRTGLDDYYTADAGAVIAQARPAPPPGPPPGPPPEPPGPPPALPASPVAPPVDRMPEPRTPLVTAPVEPLPPLAQSNPFARDVPFEAKSLDAVAPVVAGDKAVAPDDDCVPIKPKAKPAEPVAKPAARGVFTERAKVEKKVSEPAVPVKKRIVPAAVAKPRPAPDC
ncbi:MAG: hypothetical protein AB7O55_32270, partial [Lautropia sp.]